jgi:hypothetical protein
MQKQEFPFPTGGVPRGEYVEAQPDYPIDMVDEKKHNHYFKDVSNLKYIDVYRILSLYNVTDPCISHALKKLLVAGGRGAGKDIDTDIQECIDSLLRYQEMRAEDQH